MFKAMIPLAASLAFVTTAAAQSGTVSITGELTAPTCVVQVNGGTTANGTVVLPDTLTSSLGSAAATAGRTNWKIQVGTTATPCLHPNVRAMFVNGGSVNSNGRLNNTGTATNVQVQLLNGSSQVINLTNNTNSPSVTVPATGVATLDYAAEYYATAATRPGSVVTSVQYNITYP